VMNRNYLRMPLAAMQTRPELIRLLKDARRGDVLLVQSINRLSRVDDQACRSLKKAIDNRGIRIVSVDPPTSHQGMTAQSGDEFTDRMSHSLHKMFTLLAFVIRVPVCPPREINWTESSHCRSNSFRTRMG
ncbi:recombinase family protein, partial [Pseudomonas coronafaciens]